MDLPSKCGEKTDGGSSGLDLSRRWHFSSLIGPDFPSLFTVHRFTQAIYYKAMLRLLTNDNLLNQEVSASHHLATDHHWTTISQLFEVSLQKQVRAIAQPIFQLVQWFSKNRSNQFHVSFYFSFRWFGWKAFVLNSSRANQFPWRKRSCTNYRITRHSDDNYVPFNLLEWIQRLDRKQEW